MVRTGDEAQRLEASQPPGQPERPGWRQPHARVAHAYQQGLGPRERSAFASWLAFTGTFGAVRGITYAIKHHIGPVHDIKMGGTHLHHYVWGIALVSAAGGVAVYGDEAHRGHPAVGALYGAGLALVVDELALLLELRDVYWQRQGRWSIDAGVSISGLSGCYLAATEFWRHLFGRHPLSPRR